MARSVESRVPFLTPRLVEFAFTLPEECLVDNHGVTKSVVRAGMRGIVPDSILDRPIKVAAHTTNWLVQQKQLVDHVLEDVASFPVFHQSEVLQLWDAICSGRRSDVRSLWRVINTIRWAHLFGIRFE
jgi:asparagine synthase (glutamine-hydrolysing)